MGKMHLPNWAVAAGAVAEYSEVIIATIEIIPLVGGSNSSCISKLQQFYMYMQFPAALFMALIMANFFPAPPPPWPLLATSTAFLVLHAI